MMYKKNFLEKVVFRIDFDKVELGKLKNFLAKISSDFPILEEKKGAEGVINFNFKTKEVKQESNALVTWNVLNKEKTIKIQIRPVFLTIEYFQYKDKKDLLSNVQIVSDFLKEFGIKTINRLGLRYINTIKDVGGELLDWKPYIEEDLLRSIAFAKKNEQVLARSMGSMVLKKDFGNVSFNYGIWNSSYPNVISEKVFILDFDSFSKFPLDTEGINLGEIVEEYSNEISSLFELAITDKLRENMKNE